MNTTGAGTYGKESGSGGETACCGIGERMAGRGTGGRIDEEGGCCIGGVANERIEGCGGGEEGGGAGEGAVRMGLMGSCRGGMPEMELGCCA